MNHIKQLTENKGNAFCHKKFVRFGLGEFEREKMFVKFGSKIQLQSGFEYIDVIYLFLKELIISKKIDGEFKLKGVLISSKDLINDIEKIGLELKKKVGKKYTVEGSLDSNDFIKFVDLFAGNVIMSISLSSELFQIKTKGSPPKPGSLKEKFVTLKINAKFKKEFVNEFLFDVPNNFLKNAKTIEISHKYIIDDIKIPKEFENDAAKARLNAIRKGEIQRKIEINGKSTKEVIGKTIKFSI